MQKEIQEDRRLLIPYQGFGIKPAPMRGESGEPIAQPITAGSAYVDPALNGVDYHVQGTLDTTPSGFPAFNLIRSIGGLEFYAQGSSLSFAVDAAADLSDGLQVSELTGFDPVFLFNGSEVAPSWGRSTGSHEASSKSGCTYGQSPPGLPSGRMCRLAGSLI